MKREDQDYDTNSIDEENLPVGMHVMEDLEPPSDEEFENVIKKIQGTVKEFSRKGGNTTTVKEAVKQALLASKPGLKPTENTSDNIVEGDTMSAKSQKLTSIKNSTPPVAEIIPATVSPSISRDLNAEVLTSLDLIKSSAQHLHGLMISVVRSGEETDENKNPFKLTDVERAQTSAVIAKQFYSVMRLQFDAIKLVRELGDK